MKLKKLILISACTVLCIFLAGCADGGKKDAEDAMQTLQPYTEHIDEILYDDDKIQLDSEAYNAKKNDAVTLFGIEGSIIWYDLDAKYRYVYADKSEKHTDATLIYGVGWGDNKLSTLDDYEKIVKSFAALYGDDYKEKENSTSKGVRHIATWSSFDLNTLEGTADATLEVSFDESSSSGEGGISILVTDERSDSVQTFKDAHKRS